MRRSPPRRYAFCGLTVASDVALPPLRRGRGAAQCAIAIAGAVPLPGDVRWFHAWRGRRGGAWLSFGRVAGGYLLRVKGLADFVIDAGATSIVAHPAARLPADTLQHLLIDQVLPLVVARRGRPTLHASAVHINRCGTIGFVGATGRGKSTLAAALAARGARIVTDDCLALDLHARGAAVLPGYPGLRLWPGPPANALFGSGARTRVSHYSTKRRIDGDAARFHGARSPLRVLFVLSPRPRTGPAAAVRAMSAAARLMALLRSAYILDVEDRDGLGRLFSDLAAVVAAVPVVRLRVRHGTGHLAAAAAVAEEFARRIPSVLPS